MKITFVGHASVLIEEAGVGLLIEYGCFGARDAHLDLP